MNPPGVGRPIGKSDRGEIADPLAKEVAEILLDYRKKYGISRRMMAELSGVSHGSLFNMEHGIGGALLRTTAAALAEAGYELVIIPKED